MAKTKGEYAVTLSASARVDRAAGIIRGVCVMAEGELPDRGYYADNETLSRLNSLCSAYANGVKVKADHGSGIFSVTGILRNFRTEGGASRADLHILSSEENRDKLMEMAEQIPDTFGLSVSIEQELEESGGRLRIRPTSVFSIDLVTEPAACPNGLFSTRRVDAKTQSIKMNPEDIAKEFAALKDTLAKFESRIAKFETAPGEDKECMSKRLTAFETDLKSTREDFAKKITEATETTVAKVAAEFSKLIGTRTVSANPTDTTSQSDSTTKPATAADFEKIVLAEYGKTKSKAEAMKAAIAEDIKANGGKGHAAFIAAGRNVNYSKTA